MKNTKKKLVLSRETVQMLEQGVLRQVQGGLATDGPQGPIIDSCFSDC